MAEGRTIAVGDVHGCLAALCAVLGAIDPRPDDVIVTLGDYVDRGPDSRGVIERLIQLRQQCRLIPLLGNHDEMMLDVCCGETACYGEWLLYGGDAAVASYGGKVPEDVPPEHVEFLKGCWPFYETRTHIFLHANYWPTQPLNDLPALMLRWESLGEQPPGPHYSGKTAIVGHTSQKNGEILDLGHLKCIDTCCYGDGWLTALELETGRVWQADKTGRMRG